MRKLDSGAWYTSEKQDWTTPPELVSWLVEQGVMRQPTFDVAAAPHNTKAPRFFTEDDDALVQDWPSGEVFWMNPPFGRELPKFLDKALSELWKTTEHTEVWCLIPARTDTAWFHDLVWPNADMIWFLQGRINFLEHGDCKKASAPFPNMLVVFRGPWSHFRWDDSDAPPYCQNLQPTLKARGR